MVSEGTSRSLFASAYTELPPIRATAIAGLTISAARAAMASLAACSFMESAANGGSTVEESVLAVTPP